MLLDTRRARASRPAISIRRSWMTDIPHASAHSSSVGSCFSKGNANAGSLYMILGIWLGDVLTAANSSRVRIADLSWRMDWVILISSSFVSL